MLGVVNASAASYRLSEAGYKAGGTTACKRASRKTSRQLSACAVSVKLLGYAPPCGRALRIGAGGRT